MDRTISAISRVAAAVALGAALTACGGNAAMQVHGSARPGSTVVGHPTNDLVQRLAQQGLVLYESSYDYQPGVGQVLVFPASLKAKEPNPIRAITQNTVRPNGMFVDTHGDLWVVNIPQGAPTTGVYVYHPGASKPFRHITDLLDYPTDVAVAKDGTAYVNQQQCSNLDGDCVVVYPPGSNKVSHTINMNFSGYAHGAGGMAFDSKGDLYVCEFGFPHGVASATVFKITPGTLKVHDLGLQHMVAGPGLAIDGSDNLYVTGENEGQIDVFAPGSKTPTRTLQGGGYDATARPDGTLYVNVYGGVEEYAPGATSPTNFVSSPGDYGLGVAVGPRT